MRNSKLRTHICLTAILLILTFSSANGAQQVPSRCAVSFPKSIQTTLPASCSQEIGFEVIKDFTTEDSKKRLINRLLKKNNFGVSLIKFDNGKDVKTVFRSAAIPKNLECFKNLVEQNQVHTIINLYSDNKLNIFEISKSESAFFKKAGGKSYLHLLSYTDAPSAYKNKQALYQETAKIIKMIKEQPGNVLIHCLGGMHKTGVVFGVMQKCINKVPLKDIIANYKCHSEWKSESKPGGFYTHNIETIKNFPCELVK